MTFEAKGLTKNFADKQVLQGISLQTQGGKALGLLGRIGAGKTTTIRIIMGVFPADSGEILIDGQPIRRERINFGYLPEERGLYPKKIISEQLLYLAELRGSSKKAALSAMDHWLQRLEMGAYKNKKLDTLSKGNQQKIQLVATLISNPDFVILDEPFSGLDPVNAMLLKDVVHELIDDGKIVLFSSHQMSYVEEFCDDIAILHQGRIVLSGNIRDIKRSYNRNKIIVDSKNAPQIAAYTREQLPELVEKSTAEGPNAVITLRQAEQKNSLLAALASQAFDIDGIKVFEPSLNDIFVEYTEEHVQ